MKQILLRIAVVALVGCGTEKATSKVVPEKLIADPIVEKAIRESLLKLIGKLTKADLEKVTELDLSQNKLTSVKGLEKLTQLTYLNLSENKLTNVKGLEKLTQLEDLYLYNNPDLTKAQIAELKKALPKCEIYSISLIPPRESP